MYRARGHNTEKSLSSCHLTKQRLINELADGVNERLCWHDNSSLHYRPKFRVFTEKARSTLGAGGPPRVPPPPAGAACSQAERGGARSGQAPVLGGPLRRERSQPPRVHRPRRDRRRLDQRLREVESVTFMGERDSWLGRSSRRVFSNSS